MNKNQLRTGLNIVSPIAGALGAVNPAFIAVPIVASVVNELGAYFDSQRLEKRLKVLEEELKRTQLSIEELQRKIESFTEHSYYVFRNNIKAFCLSAIPETAGIYAKCLVAYLKEENQEIEEELCEIIQACNANDVELLHMLKRFINEGDKEKYEEAFRKRNDELEQYEAGKIKYRDRSNFFGKFTIFWEDLMDFYHVNGVGDMSLLLSKQLQTDREELVYDWAYIARAMVKLQNFGVLQLDFISTLGTVSQFNINRLHVTLFGQKLMEYLN